MGLGTVFSRQREPLVPSLQAMALESEEVRGEPGEVSRGPIIFQKAKEFGPRH